MILCILPSKGRPDRLLETVASFIRTRPCQAELEIVYDIRDAPALAIKGTGITMGLVPETGMANAWNRTAIKRLNDTNVMGQKKHALMGLCADDLLYKTKNWDQLLWMEFLKHGTGVYYGNDLLRTDDLGTHPFITTDIIEALGYAAPSGLKHLYLDNFWREIGKAIGRYFYLPEIITEHRHFTKYPNLRDEHYDRVNSPEMYAHDKAVFEKWRDEELPLVLPKLKSLLK